MLKSNRCQPCQVAGTMCVLRQAIDWRYNLIG